MSRIRRVQPAYACIRMAGMEWEIIHNINMYIVPAVPFEGWR